MGRRVLVGRRMGRVRRLGMSRLWIEPVRVAGG